MRRYVLPSVLITTLGGCAGHPEPQIAVAAPPPPAAVSYVALPRYATPGMTIPAARADGSYPTPNEGLSDAAASWHLRAALNVAALSCPGDQGARITVAYNTFLNSHRKVLAAANAQLIAEYRAASASDKGAFDDAMTRLYNFYAQMPARDGFCAGAEDVLTQLAAQPATGLSQVAVAALPALDRPFTDFYRAYDDWRARRIAPSQTIALTAPAQTETVAFHRIELDPALFRDAQLSQ